jgi:hypothetical protein
MIDLENEVLKLSEKMTMIREINQFDGAIDVI